MSEIKKSDVENYEVKLIRGDGEVIEPLTITIGALFDLYAKDLGYTRQPSLLPLKKKTVLHFFIDLPMRIYDGRISENLDWLTNYIVDTFGRPPLPSVEEIEKVIEEADIDWHEDYCNNERINRFTYLAKAIHLNKKVDRSVDANKTIP